MGIVDSGDADLKKVLIKQFYSATPSENFSSIFKSNDKGAIKLQIKAATRMKRKEKLLESFAGACKSVLILVYPENDVHFQTIIPTIEGVRNAFPVVIVFQKGLYYQTKNVENLPKKDVSKNKSDK